MRERVRAAFLASQMRYVPGAWQPATTRDVSASASPANRTDEALLEDAQSLFVSFIDSCFRYSSLFLDERNEVGVEGIFFKSVCVV